jgi:MFS family permease
MLFRAFPQSGRVRASSILVIPTALAPAVGPINGGQFVTDVSWRWVFYVNVPAGIAALVFGLLFRLGPTAHTPDRHLRQGAGLTLFPDLLLHGPGRR